MLTFRKVNKNNLKTAIDIQHILFPNENGKQDLIDSTINTQPPYQFLQTFYLAYHKTQPVGIVGLYAYNDAPSDAWLGWFGVLEEYRNNGFGKKMFEFAKSKALQMGFETLRLWTDEEENFTACKLYEKLGLCKENYENKEDSYYHVGKMLIYSISLTNKPVQKWNNKNLFLNLHEQKNK